MIRKYKWKNINSGCREVGNKVDSENERKYASKSVEV